MGNPQQTQVFLGLLLAFLATFLFSLKSIFIKLAYLEGLDANSVIMLRMAISLPIYISIIVYLFQQKNQPKITIKRQLKHIIFLGFIGYFLASWLDLKGLESISAGLERLTLFTYPIFTAMLGALFFNAPMSKKIMAVLLMTYLGLWLMFNQEIKSGVNTNDAVTGVTLVLFSALSYAFYVLFSKKIIGNIGPIWFTAIAMSASSLFVLMAYFLGFDFNTLVVSNKAWLWLFLLAVFSTVIPSFLISMAIDKTSPLKTSIIGMLGPVITIILAVLVLSEPFNINHVFGILLVISGVVLLSFGRD